MNMHEGHIARWCARFGNHRHGPRIRRNRGKSITHLAGKFVTKHGAKRIADGIHPISVYGILRRDIVDHRGDKIDVLHRRLIAVKLPGPLVVGQPFPDRESQYNPFRLGEFFERILLRKKVRCRIAACKNHQQREVFLRRICRHKKMVLAFHAIYRNLRRR